MIACKECGQENMEGLEYCDGCGAKLEAPDAAESAPALEAEASTPEAEAPAPEAEASALETQATESPALEVEETPTSDLEEPAPTLQVAIPSPAPEESAPAPQEPASPLQQIKVTITRGGTLGKEFLLQMGDNLVGRWDPDSGAFPEVDLEADDPEARVSRKHALICVGEQITIEDIGSLNGTYVNRGPRLEPGTPVTLKDGDEIIIGKTFFKIAVA